MIDHHSFINKVTENFPFLEKEMQDPEVETNLLVAMFPLKDYLNMLIKENKVVELKKALQVLNNIYVKADTQLSNMIAVGIIEHLNFPDKTKAKLIMPELLFSIYKDLKI